MEQKDPASMRSGQISDNDVLATKASLANLQRPMDEIISKVTLPKRVRKVAIKVNLCDYRTAESGATSDPRVVEALIKSIKRIYNDPLIQIVETDASGTDCDSLFSFLGFKRLEREQGVSLVNLRHSRWIDTPLNGRLFKNIEIPEIVAEADLFVNHPKLKTHGKTKITVGLKNIFGCLRLKYKARYHPVLDDAIVDVNRAIPSGLIVVDGIIALEGWGPTYGLPKPLGLLIAGRNVVSVDAFCADLMGFGARSVPHVALAERTGLGSTKYNIPYGMDKSILGSSHFKFDPLRYRLKGLAESQIA
jgi:uncharacterized protein (DUF362 family)